MEWTKIAERMPEPGKAVLACINVPRYNKPPEFNQVILRAVWYPRWYEVANTDDEVAEYSEDKDEYYLKEGWYEWNQEEETHFFVSDPVTHWMPLPDPPNKEDRAYQDL